MGSTNTYTTQDLVNNIKLITHIPPNNSTFDITDIINLANRELQTPILKQILSTRGGYYKTYVDLPIDPTGLYLIPSEAIGGALENVELIQGPTIVPVNIIEEAEQFSTISPTSTSYGCFMKGNYVQILPTPNVGVCRLWFAQRPSKLVPITLACQVISVSGNDVTVNAVPSNIQIGSYVDTLSAQPPFVVYDADNLIANIVGTVITLTDPPSALLAADDWIALNQQTPIPQIPVEFRPLLEQRTTLQIYETQGYAPKIAAAEKKLKELEEATFSLITTRIKSQTKIISPINGGFLSGNQNRMTNFPAGKNS